MIPGTLPPIPQGGEMTTQDYAYQRLRNAVMVGALAPGTALTFRGLAQQLDLSPTPIREAVRRLSSENAIEVLENRRLRIPQMSLGRFEELVRMRVSLEIHAAQRAFPHLTAMVIEDLRRLDDSMDSAIETRDLDALTRLNHRFHEMLYCLNPHQVVMPLIESIWLQLGPFQRRVIEDIDSIKTVDRHKEILAALSARDLPALCTAIERDIRDGSIRSGRQMLVQRGES